MLTGCIVGMGVRNTELLHWERKQDRSLCTVWRPLHGCGSDGRCGDSMYGGRPAMGRRSRCVVPPATEPLRCAVLQSLGYGFVEVNSEEVAREVIKKLQVGRGERGAASKHDGRQTGKREGRPRAGWLPEGHCPTGGVGGARR